ncbi:glycosyltransferase [candidate division KSB1 bacterium]|nr:glycosyltransferase [candidate division KSB1 bacterium]
MRKVLIIAYYFPPSGGSGVQRVLKFVKYLRDYGWEPVVLTASNADYPVLDTSLAEDIPSDVKIYRARIIEPYAIYRKLTKQSDRSVDVLIFSQQHTKQSIAQRFSESIRAALFVPDARICWLPFAIRMGKKIITREKIDLIFSSAPPYTTHLIGLGLQHYSGLPWIADFRDSWIGWFTTPQRRPYFSRALERKMEQRVLKKADKIIAVTKGVKDDLVSRHQECLDSRWNVLCNGFDPDDIEPIEPVQRPNDKIIVTYTGTIVSHHIPLVLTKALELLYDTEPEVVGKFIFRFIGRMGDPLKQQIKDSRVGQIFEFKPYMPHTRSIAHLKSTDYCLLIIDDVPGNSAILTGKLFEYIGVGKPILALVPQGNAAELIEDLNLGKVINPQNAIEISQVLRSIVSHPIVVKSDKQYQYSRKFQTKVLAGYFDSLAK